MNELYVAPDMKVMECIKQDICKKRSIYGLALYIYKIYNMKKE